MNKKGASHIDWVVSIGIFIVYILILLVWIKPSYKPVFEEDVLIGIVRDNIEETYTIEVDKTLIVLNGCNINSKHNFNLNNHVPGLSSGDFTVLRVSDGLVADYKGTLTVKTYTTGKNSYWIINSDKSYDSSHGGDLDALPEAECSSVQSGETITKKGLSGFALPSIGANAATWGFPTSREFKILLQDIYGEKIVCYNKEGSLTKVACDEFEADSGASVFVGEWRYNVIKNEFGDTDPVIVTIQVW
tara:strand:- start:71 stop:808 length:738 start_codon:yes stop_codon:yes gene_type:complete